MCARDVDSYLSDGFTALPVTGGITKRQPYAVMKPTHGHPLEMVSASA